MNPNGRPVLALDVGGTKLAAGVVAPDGTVVTADRVPTPAGPENSAADVFEAVTRLLDRVHVDAGSPEIAGVGVGCGGPMLWPAGEVSPINIHPWRGFPLRASVASRYPDIPVRLHNDALCFAIAEHWQGAGRGLQSILGIVVSTGVGGGIVYNGRAVSGDSGNAGHIGHIVIDPLGPQCGCGGRGCLEAIARGPAIAAWAVEQGWTPSRTELGATAVAVEADARAGNPVAIEALARAGRALGIGIASALALLDVSAVIIGGGVSACGDLVFEPMQQALTEYAQMHFTRDVPVMTAQVGRHAGIVGAAALILAGDQYWEEPS